MFKGSLARFTRKCRLTIQQMSPGVKEISYFSKSQRHFAIFTHNVTPSAFQTAARYDSVACVLTSTSITRRKVEACLYVLRWPSRWKVNMSENRYWSLTLTINLFISEYLTNWRVLRKSILASGILFFFLSEGVTNLHFLSPDYSHFYALRVHD